MTKIYMLVNMLKKHNILKKTFIKHKRVSIVLPIILSAIITITIINSSKVYADVGTGADGICNVSGTINLNTQSCAGRGTPDAVNYTLASSASAGQYTIVASGASGITSGNEILIIDLQGSNAGTYETQWVSSVSGNIIYTINPLIYSYSTLDHIMIQRVPNYTSVTINGGSILTANAWNGSSGGVVFFRATGTVTNSGTINMSYKGFMGGGNDANGPEGNTGRQAVNGGAGGGGGTAGGGNPGYNGTNGAGGGAGSNATWCPTCSSIPGGAGGSGGPRGGGGGSTAAGKAAGYPGYGYVNGGRGSGGIQCDTRNSSGGGGASYNTGTSSTSTTAATLQLGGGASSGAGGGVAAGGGGAPYSGNTGGNGGGIVYIVGHIISNSGTINSGGGNGGVGAAGGAPYCDYDDSIAGGGGGSGGNGANGGPIVIIADTVTLGSNLVTSIASSGGVGGGGRGVLACNGGNNGCDQGYSTGYSGSSGAGAPGVAGNPGTIVVKYTSSLSGSTNPGAYITQNYPPTTPSLDAPTNGASGSSATTFTPVLKTTTTDSSGDYLRYKIQMCTDAGMTANCQIFDQTVFQTGWSGQNTQSGTAYTSGTQGVYSIQTPLAENTTYYWRAYAIDPGGIDFWSTTQGTPNSFTTYGRPDTPTLNSPTNAASNQALIPILRLTATDINTSDYLKYKIQIDTVNTFGSGNLQTFDQTLSQTGWSGQNNGPGGNTAYTQGTQATFTVPALLLENTQYYWRAYAIDPAGANTWSDNSATSSFTTSHKPNVPSLVSPTDTAASVVLNPLIKIRAWDTDSDYLRYKIELCTNLAMTVGCQTFDQTANQTGWSGQNAQGVTAYASNTAASYFIQTSLAANTTYYWRAYAIDPGGANSWSTTQTTPYSFTTQNPTGSSACYIDDSNKPTQATAHWSDMSSSETGYQLEKNIDSGAFGSTQNLAANTTTYTDTTSANHLYQYRIRATFTGGEYSDWCVTPQVNYTQGTLHMQGVKFGNY